MPVTAPRGLGDAAQVCKQSHGMSGHEARPTRHGLTCARIPDARPCAISLQTIYQSIVHEFTCICVARVAGSIVGVDLRAGAPVAHPEHPANAVQRLTSAEHRTDVRSLCSARRTYNTA